MLSLYLPHHLLVLALLGFLLAVMAVLLLLVLLDGPLEELGLLSEESELLVLLALALYQFPLHFLDHQVLRSDFGAGVLELARVLGFLEFGLLLPIFFLGQFLRLHKVDGLSQGDFEAGEFGLVGLRQPQARLQELSLLVGVRLMLS
jgi:hypothetical protein